jgi:hypothetical protein
MLDGRETGAYGPAQHNTWRGIMKRTLAALVTVTCVSLFAIAQDTGIEIVNLSADRQLGVGIQLDFPYGGLISTRYWLDPTYGLEGILFLWGDEMDVEGTVTARGLYRIADAPVVDFYGAVGASLPFSMYGYGLQSVILSVAGGIEFGFRFAPSLAWNIEFGLAYALDGQISMLFGTGIHFYFLGDAEESGR